MADSNEAVQDKSNEPAAGLTSPAMLPPNVAEPLTQSLESINTGLKTLGNKITGNTTAVNKLTVNIVQTLEKNNNQLNETFKSLFESIKTPPKTEEGYKKEDIIALVQILEKNKQETIQTLLKTKLSETKTKDRPSKGIFEDTKSLLKLFLELKQNKKETAEQKDKTKVTAEEEEKSKVTPVGGSAESVAKSADALLKTYKEQAEGTKKTQNKKEVEVKGEPAVEVKITEIDEKVLEKLGEIFGKKQTTEKKQDKKSDGFLEDIFELRKFYKLLTAVKKSKRDVPSKPKQLELDFTSPFNKKSGPVTQSPRYGYLQRRKLRPIPSTTSSTTIIPQKTTTTAVPASSKSIAKKIGGTTVKTLLKKIPLLGLGVGSVLAAGKLAQGDITGAGLEFTSGALSTVPGLGTAGSLAIDTAIAAREISRGNTENKTPKAAAGGIFEGSKSGYMVQLHGKEAVVPLEKNNVKAKPAIEPTLPETRVEAEPGVKVADLSEKQKDTLAENITLRPEPTNTINAVAKQPEPVAPQKVVAEIPAEFFESIKRLMQTIPAKQTQEGQSMTGVANNSSSSTVIHMHGKSGEDINSSRNKTDKKLNYYRTLA